MIRLLLFVFTLASIGCATTVKPERAQKYIGKEGYFSRPISTIEKSLPHCEKYRIAKLTSNMGFISIHVESGGAKEEIYYLNRERPTAVGENEITIELLDKYFSEEKPKFSNSKVKLQDGKFSEEELLCRGTVWTDMPKEKFLFVYGKPESINVTAGKGYNHEQWVYPGPEAYKNKYFYFYNEKLRSWQH